MMRYELLLRGLRGCAATAASRGLQPAVDAVQLAAATRCYAAAVEQSGRFAVPSHIPDPNEPWPEGRRPPEGWWVDPEIDTAEKAYNIFDASLEKHRHLRQRHIQEIIKRCKDGEDLKLAVAAMDKLMRFRRAQQHHGPFNLRTGKMLVQQAVYVGSPKVAAQAFERYAELGLTPTVAQVTTLAVAMGRQGELDGIVRLLNAARKAGVRTTPNMAYVAARTAMQSDQKDQGLEMLKEMEVNGVRLRPSCWSLLDGSKPAVASSEDAAGSSVPEGAHATSSAAAEDRDGGQQAQEAASEEGAGASAAAGAPPGVAS